MKLWVLSDLHLEGDDMWLPSLPADADVAIVAGDVMPGPGYAVRWLAPLARRMPVVYVLGNHEFYGHSVFEGLEWARESAAAYGVHLLERDAMVLGGTRFLGCTLWTDFLFHVEDGDDEQDRAAEERVAKGEAARRMVDYRRIRKRRLPAEEPWTPELSQETHRRSVAWLHAEFRKPFDGRTVVVTHHAPHRQSVHPQFASDLLTPSYVSDLSEQIGRWQPDLWVHGHVHDSCDYRVGRTRVLCNPRGYGRENHAFDPGLVVEV